jgi:hypothetical protein
MQRVDFFMHAGWAEKLLTEPIPGTHRISTRFRYFLYAIQPSSLTAMRYYRYICTGITGYVTLQGPGSWAILPSE